MSRPTKPKPRQKKANGYKMPESIPQGFIIKDGPRKKEWQIGTSIGKGGFGEIYCASLVEEKVRAVKKKSKNNSFPYVVKIEPQENGPLFVEMHVYMKLAKQEDMDEWIKERQLKSFGMPSYLGSGSFDYNNEKYRFLVMDRYGENLWTKFCVNKIFPYTTVLRIALQIIDVLEYIHSKGYAHCDVKGSNLVVGLKPGTENQVFLVDFGLAAKYSTDADFKPDRKNAHNGTIEYTSRDLHQGVVTRRGDMEVLGFNLVHWLNTKLPWEKDIADAKVVEAKKNELMSSLTKTTYINQNLSVTPRVIIKFLSYITKLKHDQEPDYASYRKLFIEDLKRLGTSETGELIFGIKPEDERKLINGIERTQTPKKKAKTTAENGHISPKEDDNVNEKPVAVKRKVAKKKDEVNWKTCPSAIASNIVKAGEYKGKTETGEVDKKPKAKATRPRRKQT